MFKKKFLILSLIAFISILSTTPVFAANEQNSINIIPLSNAAIEQQLIAKIHKEAMSQIDNNKIVKSSLSPHDWKIKYGKTQKVNIAGYAGGQPKNGTRFKTKGGFYYNPNGGRTVSIGVSFPTPFLKISVSANVGRSVGKSEGGEYVEVPSTKYFYKLYVKQTFSAKSYITYHKVNGKWKQYTKGTTKVLLSREIWAKKQ